MQYEDETLQAMALSCIPDDELREEAQQQVHEARAKGQHMAEQDAMTRQLLDWFKHKFFTWVSQPHQTCIFSGTVHRVPLSLNLHCERVWHINASFTSVAHQVTPVYPDSKLQCLPCR